MKLTGLGNINRDNGIHRQGSRLEDMTAMLSRLKSVIE